MFYLAAVEEIAETLVALAICVEGDVCF